jgi:hypothetical protein
LKVELSREELKLLIQATGLISVNMLLLEKENAGQYLELQDKLQKIKKSY